MERATIAGMADPAERLRALKRRVDDHKDSLQAPLSLAMLTIIGLVPSSVQDVLIDFLATKATVLMTNVIGPQERLYLAGTPLEALMFWVPQAGGVGVGVSILSYAGQVRLGVLTDAGLVPDPEAVITGFHAEFDAMSGLAQETEERRSLKELLVGLSDTLDRLDTVLDDIAQAAQNAAGR